MTEALAFDDVGTGPAVCCHMPNLEAPDEFNEALVDFLSGLR
jgi:hypothetical protein